MLGHSIEARDGQMSAGDVRTFPPRRHKGLGVTVNNVVAYT